MVRQVSCCMTLSFYPFFNHHHGNEDLFFFLFAASTYEIWIGINDIQREGLFDWSDHTTVSFTSWEFGRPSVATDQEDCVLIRGEVIFMLSIFVLYVLFVIYTQALSQTISFYKSFILINTLQTFD